VTGVRRILNNAADRAVFRPAYAAGFLVGHFVGGVALYLLGASGLGVTLPLASRPYPAVGLTDGSTAPSRGPFLFSRPRP
jgi:hypothetical protein